MIPPAITSAVTIGLTQAVLVRSGINRDLVIRITVLAAELIPRRYLDSCAPIQQALKAKFASGTKCTPALCQNRRRGVSGNLP